MTKSLSKQIFFVTNEVRQHAPKGLVFSSFGGRVEVFDFICSQSVPMKFSLCSHQIPNEFSTCSPSSQ
jgi:hypothetical protein